MLHQLFSILAAPFVAIASFFSTPPPPPPPPPIVIERPVIKEKPIFVDKYISEITPDQEILLQQMLAQVQSIALQVQEISNKKKFGASFSTGEVVALFEDSLASGITASSTTFTLTRGTNKEGTALASSTYGMIIAEGGSDEEMVLADCTSTACTNVTRGLSVVTGTTSIYANIKAHRRGDSVKITDAPILLFVNNLLKGRQNLENIIEYSSAPSFSKNNQIVTKSYVDGSANSGAATSTETTTGISRLATLTQTASSTASTANTPLVIQAQSATSTPGANVFASGASGQTYVVVSKDNGKISQDWIDLSENFTLTGRNIFKTATTSFQATTTFDVPFSATSTRASTLSYATTTSITVADTASTTNLIISGTCAFGSGANAGCLGYTGSSTAINYAVTTTCTGCIPASANFGIANAGILDGGVTVITGTIFIARSGITTTRFGNNAVAANDGSYTFQWSGNDLIVTEDNDDATDSALNGTTFYWYR